MEEAIQNTVDRLAELNATVYRTPHREPERVAALRTLVEAGYLDKIGNWLHSGAQDRYVMQCNGWLDLIY